MKKMLLASAPLAYLIQDVLNGAFTVKQTSSSSTKGNHHPSFLRFKLGRRNCRCSQNLWHGAENIVKTKPSKLVHKWIARFYYFEHLCSAGSACVLLTVHELPIDTEHSIYLLINILLGSFQLFFCIVISLSPEGEK